MQEASRSQFVALGHAGPDHYWDDVAEALELPTERVRVTLRQKVRGGIAITATS